MRIGVNLCGVDPHATRGADDAVLRTVEHLVRRPDDGLDFVLFGLADLADGRPELAELVETHLLPLPRSFATRVLAEHAWLPRRMAKAGLDLVHDATGTAASVAGMPTVVHLPGLTALEHRRIVHPLHLAQLRRTIPRALADAKTVVVPSEFVKQRVVERFATATSRIHVVPWPLPRHDDPMPIETVRARYGIIGDIILLPSVTHAHKEHVVAVRALDHIVDRHRELTLVLTGSAGSSERLVQDEIERLELRDRVVRIETLSASAMSALYEDASVVVYPAVYGDFAHSVLEAMASGVPVIVSSSGAAPEVVGDAGAVIDPGDDAQLAIELHRILDDEEWRSGKVADGLSIASAYTLDNTADGLLAAYRSVAVAL